VVACVVVEVKVQQRRPDGGSIPPIARIDFFLLFLCLAQQAEPFSFAREKLGENFDAGLDGGSCVPRLCGAASAGSRVSYFAREREKKYCR
jgi:hypothetical protein